MDYEFKHLKEDAQAFCREAVSTADSVERHPTHRNRAPKDLGKLRNINIRMLEANLPRLRGKAARRSEATIANLKAQVSA